MQAYMEREAKFRLSQNTQKQLIQLFTSVYGSALLLQQQNRFFETDSDSLHAHRCALRLRQQNQNCILTIKQKQPQLDLTHATQANRVIGGALHQHLEFERHIHSALWPPLTNNAVAINHVIELHPCIDHARAGQDLLCIGGFSNQRHLWHIPDAEICLDRTTFNNGHVDYELEIESPQAEKVSAMILVLLDQWQITYHPQTESKMSRFLKHKNT